MLYCTSLNNYIFTLNEVNLVASIPTFINLRRIKVHIAKNQQQVVCVTYFQITAWRNRNAIGRKINM